MKDLICILGILVWGWGLLLVIMLIFYAVPIYGLLWLFGAV